MLDFREAHPTADSLDDTGCQRLAAAIVLQAASDMYQDLEFNAKYPGLSKRYNCIWPDNAGSIKSIREFIFSKWFNCLTDLDPKKFYDTIIFWFRRKKDLSRYIAIWRDKYEKIDQDPEPAYYEPQMLRNVLNDERYYANWRYLYSEPRFERKETL